MSLKKKLKKKTSLMSNRLSVVGIKARTPIPAHFPGINTHTHTHTHISFLSRQTIGLKLLLTLEFSAQTEGQYRKHIRANLQLQWEQGMGPSNVSSSVSAAEAP